MDQQEARDILKGCGGCILIVAILFIGLMLLITVGEKVLLALGCILAAIIFYSPYALLALLVLLAMAFVVFMIKVILKACGII